jgi:hypothetical protein
MKRSMLISLKEKLSAKSSTPWACFETCGPSDDGRIAFSISCNDAFVKNLHKFGYQGISDEETVQNFFLAARIIPEELLNSGPEVNVNPSGGTPHLTDEANRFVK